MISKPMLKLVCSLAILPAAVAPGATQQCTLENSALRFHLVVADGVIRSRSLENRLTGKNLSLPTAEFLLEFSDGSVIAPQQCTVALSSTGPQAAELLFRGRSGQPAGEVRVRYELPPGKSYLRKQIALRDPAATGRRLLRADLENWKGVRENWDSMHADALPFGSHPIFCEDLWAGVEFVAAFNEYAADGFVLRSRPGGKPLGAAWLALHSTVIGASERGQVRNAFLRYLDDIRRAPARMVCCYNSWWTLPKKVTADDILALTGELKRRMFDRHGVFFDVMATDAGWTDPQTIWQIDRRHLPRGFAGLRDIVESAGGKLGLWISPSSIYSSALDYDWARQNGFRVVKQRSLFGMVTGVSLADPTYRQKTVEQLRRLIAENRFAHIKFDGFIPQEDTPHHDLLPGPDSVEPLAEHALELIAVSHRANPELVSEPTFLNSWMNYISPWILKYADTIFGNSGGDYPRAVGPAPDYREACTNAREWYIFSSLDEVWLPQNALQYFDIIHCDAAPGFANHAAMAIGRGRFFLPAYVNPKYVTDDEWALFAGLLRWARANQEVLRQTIVLPARVELGEPYAYAHWLGKRGIVAIRNPSNQSQLYRLDLRAAGAPAELADGVCYTQYPYRRGIAAAVDARAVVPVKLGPWELLFVEIVPRAQLREPVAIGARWYRDPQGRMRVSPDAGVTRVEVLEPGGAAHASSFSPAPDRAPTGKVLADGVAPLPKSAWLEAAGKALTSVAFNMNCSVSIPAGSQGKVLLLVEFPGRVHARSTCKAIVNGVATPLEERPSTGYIGYLGGTHRFDPKSYWAGMIPYTSEWTWYICPVGGGSSRVVFSGKAATGHAKVGAWVWSDYDSHAAARPLDVVCSRPEMPQYGDRIERQGVCIQASPLPLAGEGPGVRERGNVPRVP